MRRSLPVETGVTKLLDLDRCYSVSKIPVSNGKALCLYNLHLSAYTSDGKIADEQLELLLSDMQAEYEAGNYVIGGGDFNKDLLEGGSEAYFGVSTEDYTWAQPLRFDLLEKTDIRLIAPQGKRRRGPHGPQRGRSVSRRAAGVVGRRLSGFAECRSDGQRGRVHRLCLL